MNPSKPFTFYDETFEFLANLEPADDSPVISDGEIIIPEIPAYDINKDFWSYIYSRDSNEETFLNSHNITFQDCVKIEKDTRTHSDCSMWFELCKPRITSGICHRISYVRGILHGKKFESRAHELFIDVM